MAAFKWVVEGLRRGSAAVWLRYLAEVLSVSEVREKICRGTGRTPLTHGRQICSGWSDRGTSMNLGDSGGICPLGVKVVVGTVLSPALLALAELDDAFDMNLCADFA